GGLRERHRVPPHRLPPSDAGHLGRRRRRGGDRHGPPARRGPRPSGHPLTAMSTQAEVVWDPGFTRYDFGPTHPMSPVRLDLTARLCDAFGLFGHADVRRLVPPVASDGLLQTGP